MKRDTRSAYRARAAATERMVDAAVTDIHQARDKEWRDAKAKAAEANVSPDFTREQLAGATAVRDRFGWHRVLHVNRKTVTVETGWSWSETIPLPKVLEVRFEG